MNVEILNDAKSKLTSNMIQNMRILISIVSMLLFELTLPYLITTKLKHGLKRCLRLP